MSRLPFRYLIIVSLLLAAVAIALAPQLRNIVYRSEIIEYFQPEDSRVHAFRGLENAFGYQQSLLVLLQTDNNSFLDSDKLLQLSQLETELRAISGVTRIQS